MLRPLLNTPKLGDLEDYIRIVAAALICGEPLFHGVTALLHHSTTTKFVPLSNLINEPYPSLRVPQKRWEVIVSRGASAMQRRHGGRYN